MAPARRAGLWIQTDERILQADAGRRHRLTPWTLTSHAARTNLEAMSDTMPAKRWTRIEYDRLIDKGVLGPENRIELLGGALVVREPQGSRHAMGIRMAEEALRRVFAGGWDVHPPRAVLIVEVAESSLALDRIDKGSLYARAGLLDYWVATLADHALEVYRAHAGVHLGS